MIDLLNDRVIDFYQIIKIGNYLDYRNLFVFQSTTQ
jgi:hypothetical protein